MMTEDILTTLRNVKKAPYILNTMRNNLEGIEQIMARAGDEIAYLRAEIEFYKALVKKYKDDK